MMDSSTVPTQPHFSLVRLFFGLTIGLGAGLLFWQQLLIGREMLPKFGGVPAVWLVSLAAFQTLLLLAYALAHAMRKQSRGKILTVILALAALAAVQQIFHPALVAPNAITPNAVLAALIMMAGGSLFLLSMISPVMQGLYARTSMPDAKDPYFFYAASNFGSFAGLLLFPLVLEPFFGVAFSQKLWLGFAGLFLACLIGSVMTVQKLGDVKVEQESSPEACRRWPLWLFYSFLPSALSFSATAHLINDIAPVPLLSMVPLALYLLTFIMAFGKQGGWKESYAGIHTFIVAFYLFRLIGSGIRLTQGLDLVLVLAAFFATALVFHSRLAASRPPAGNLTFYYLIVALGGALGALVNIFIVPFVLPIPIEFALFLLIGLLPSLSDDLKKLREGKTRKLHLTMGVFALATTLSLYMQGGDERFAYITLPLLVITFVLLSLRPSMLALLACVMITLTFTQMPELITAQRDFFGVKKIVEKTHEDGNLYRAIYHGTTFHGGQQITPAISTEPLFYYGKGSGFYDGVEIAEPKRMGIIGMGAASNACKRPPGGDLVFFEIDPGMVSLANHYFTFLEKCPSTVVVGDGRLTLEKMSSQFDFLLIDAFSSDAIPVHLLTREAFQIYATHLQQGGLLLIHISNRYLDLKPVVMGGAEAEGLIAATKFYTPGADEVSVVASEYVAMSRDPVVINRLINERGWRSLKAEPMLWTDDKLSLVPVLKIFRKTSDAQKN